MTSLRIGIALALCVATATPGWAEESAGRPVTTFANVMATTFAKVCLAKPDSISTMNALAAAQGLALDRPGAPALAEAESNDPFNLLVHWRLGTGTNRLRLTGLIGGNSDRYELGCILDGYGVQPLDVLAAMKTILGEPARRTVKENTWIELTWTGDVTLSYREGEGQRTTLTLVQMLGKTGKP